ncbi:MAG: T9SS type A sorting domain-containing protein [Flavobacteriales bacterium]
MRSFLLFIYLFSGTFFTLSAQWHIANGTNVLVHDSTVLSFEKVNGIIIIDSNTTVVNNGLWKLGFNSQLNEQPGFPINGNGAENARMFIYPQAVVSGGNLGLIVRVQNIADTMDINRFHTALVSQNTDTSIYRWFRTSTASGTSVIVDSVTFLFDPTELHSLQQQKMMLHTCTDTITNTWTNRGIQWNYNSYSAGSIADTLSFLSLFEASLILDSCNKTSFCSGDTLIAYFHYEGVAPQNDSMSLELSDATGNFSASSFIDSSFWNASVPMSYSIPTSVISGNNFLLKLSGLHPQIYDSDTHGPVSIYSNPDATFTGLDPFYCFSAATDTLFPVTSGGVFSGPGTSSTAFTASLAAAGNHTIVYSVTNAGGCASTSAQQTVVYTGPAVPVISQLANTLQVSGSWISFQWMENGIPVAGATSGTFQPANDGLFTVEVTDTNGCSAVSAPYTFLYYSIREMGGNYFSVFPNPFQHQLTIHAASTNDPLVLAEIITITGSVVAAFSVSSSLVTLNLEELPVAAYQLRLKNKSGLSRTLTIIKVN